MAKEKPDLNAAYALQTPQDSVSLYRDWAETYDQSFAEQSDYAYPETIARVFSEHARIADDPVLDVGAGTGLVGSALARRGNRTIDGADISPEMLAVARTKKAYRALFTCDLTQRISPGDATYGGIVSAGTFTHGHVGPDAFDELVRVARPGALFVLGINAEFFDARGFGRKLAEIGPHIVGLNLRQYPIYGQGADKAHRDDKASVAIFRKR